MLKLCCDVLRVLSGQTLVTAESCTGGSIGAALTAVPGSSAVYKGGIVSYCNEVKHTLLGVDRQILESCGAVSAPVAESMALEARNLLKADVSVSVTGLAGPDGDDFGNPVGLVYIGYADARTVLSKEFRFSGSREQIREQAVCAALQVVLRMNA